MDAGSPSHTPGRRPTGVPILESLEQVEWRRVAGPSLRYDYYARGTRGAGNPSSTYAMSSLQPSFDRDAVLMRAAAEASRLCTPSPGAYSVGAVLVSPDGITLATGYSRELPGNTHAEECCLVKAREASLMAVSSSSAAAITIPRTIPLALSKLATITDLVHDRAGVFSGCTMYSTMEPCSHRLSGKPSCASLIISAGIARVVMGLAEPPNFVVCEGVAQLEAAGVRVDRCADAVALDMARSVNCHLV